MKPLHFSVMEWLLQGLEFVSVSWSGSLIFLPSLLYSTVSFPMSSNKYRPWAAQSYACWTADSHTVAMETEVGEGRGHAFMISLRNGPQIGMGYIMATSLSLSENRLQSERRLSVWSWSLVSSNYVFRKTKIKLHKSPWKNVFQVWIPFQLIAINFLF